jgi:hypothetical protein
MTAVVVLFALFPFDKLFATMTLTQYSRQVYPDEPLVFYNWRQACDYVNDHLCDGDIIWTTMENATEYYIGKESFNLTLASFNGTAQSTETSEAGLDFERYNFSDVLRKNSRGWAITDPRTNIKVDKNIINVIFKQMRYHYDVSGRDIGIFSWDTASPESQKMFYVRFSEERTMIEYGIRRTPLDPDSTSTIVLDCEAIDSPNEAQCLVNQHAIPIPPGQSNGREQISFQVPKEYVTKRENSLFFRYTPSSDERRKGYALYGLRVLTTTTGSVTQSFE